MVNSAKTVNIILGVVFGIAVLFAGNVYAAKREEKTVIEEKFKHEKLFKKYAIKYDVPWELLVGIATTESSLNQNAINEKELGGRAKSVGLMQLLFVPKPDGSPGPKNELPAVSEWSDVQSYKDLFDPETNIRIGAQILSWNIEHYGTKRGIAMYNSYDQRNKPFNGPFSNQYYVDRVIGYAKKYGWIDQ